MPSLTDVPGIAVGHATDLEARTGCTVVLGPFRAACDIRGLATGTRELDALSATHVVPRIDAILLTGGSAFGLQAAGGVVRWLEERGIGFETGAAKVPIVPAAVIYDLGVGRADRRPDEAMGRAACEAAGHGPVAEGPVGAGTGATVGKVLGPGTGAPSGVGSWSLAVGDYTVGALVVANAFGDVLDGRGGILAGARGRDGEPVDAARLLREGAFRGGWGAPSPEAGTNTTLAVVATDAPLTRTALETLARMAATAVPRRISPVHTPFDGDITFALSTADTEVRLALPDLVGLGAAAAYALETAIEHAVTRR